ncbi:MAG: DUF4263 domain-containing protein [Deltaproteobacteria bacterium]|nr:DUF4263 domain-containing protein [Deltaproteobacteria bacterium]
MDGITRFRQLLDSAESELEIQSFLEGNPYLLLDFLMSPKAKVITQFPLGSDFRPDFAFVHSNSGGNFLELMELEHPNHNIFNCDGSFSQQFNHALQQVQDWIAWCRAHQEATLRQIKPLIRYLKSENLYVNALLVMGRRRELSNRQRQERFEARLHHLPRGIQFRTYDGFAERLEDCQK